MEISSRTIQCNKTTHVWSPHLYYSLPSNADDFFLHTIFHWVQVGFGTCCSFKLGSGLKILKCNGSLNCKQEYISSHHTYWSYHRERSRFTILRKDTSTRRASPCLFIRLSSLTWHTWGGFSTACAPLRLRYRPFPEVSGVVGRVYKAGSSGQGKTQWQIYSLLGGQGES